MYAPHFCIDLQCSNCHKSGATFRSESEDLVAKTRVRFWGPRAASPVPTSYWGLGALLDPQWGPGRSPGPGHRQLLVHSIAQRYV